MDTESLWRLWRWERSPEARERLILAYAPLVKSCASALRLRLPPEVEYGDLVSNGMIGLVEAVERYDPAANPDFVSYARKRIFGAMVDGMRREGSLPRAIYEKKRWIREARDELVALLQREPGEAEVAGYLGLEEEEYDRLAAEVASAVTVSLEGALGPDDDGHSLLEVLEDRGSPDPASLGERRAAQEEVRQALRTLPERYRIILEMHYFRELSLREIAGVLSLSPSRVSQMHNAALTRLRRALAGEASRLTA